MLQWREAMERGLYGSGGFFSAGPGPRAHFRTSVHASPLFAAALGTLLDRLDAALGRPDPLDVVDIGAGRGELLTALLAGADAGLARRLRPVAVELAPRPDGPPAAVDWRSEAPPDVTGLVVGTEWLDNVPVDVAEADGDGVPRLVLVDPATGAEELGGPVAVRDADWLRRWWPLSEPGGRAEIGWPRDDAWAAAVRTVRRGAALAVDYGHRRADRPPLGTLTGFRDGRQTAPVPDGTGDLTAHVAWDALVAAAGGTLYAQRAALHALGVRGDRPPLALAGSDPAGYLRALSAASQAGELTDPAGLGGHGWLLRTVGVDVGL